VLDDSENAFIARNLIVSSSDSSGIVGEFSGHTVNIQGTLSGADNALLLGNSGSEDFGQRVVIGRDGYVATASDGYTALQIYAYDSVVRNEGEVWGARYAVRMVGVGDETTSRLVNNGTISSDVYAVIRDGNESFSLINSGRLLTDRNGYAFLSAGEGEDTLVNTGRIDGGVRLGRGNDLFDGRQGHLAGAVEGHDGNDRILCGRDDDRISGGYGMDVLSGGAGRDTFVFDVTLHARKNVDLIADFKPVIDTIELGDLAFEGLDEGMLLAGQFVANTTGKASDALDRIIYETDTGNLYFDADGKGGEKAVLFATLDKDLAIDHRDFEIVTMQRPIAKDDFDLL
jgi:Ca2+-binding RTX toxin-like protein